MSYFDDNDYENPNDDNDSIISSSDSDTDDEPIIKKNPIKKLVGGENIDADIDIDDDDLEDDILPSDDEQDGGDIDDDDDELDDDDLIEEPGKIIREIPTNLVNSNLDDDEDSDEDNEQYLKKFDKEINNNYIMNFHPECVLHNYDEIAALSKIVRNQNNIIIDPLHRTIPFLTKYERARILGQRAKQINSGATPFIKVPENIIDGYLIAELELNEKRVPFIIRRPLPNGGSEYWNIKDLEIVSF